MDKIKKISLILLSSIILSMFLTSCQTSDNNVEQNQAEALNKDNDLLKLLNNDSTDIQDNPYITDNMFQNLNIQLKSSNTEVTLRQIAGSGYSIYILADITAPEGTVFNSDNIYRLSEYEFKTSDKNDILSLSETNIPIFISMDLVSATENSNKATFLFTIFLRSSSGIDSLLNKNVSFSFKGIESVKKAENLTETIQGNFKFIFESSINDTSKTYTVNKDITVWGGTAHIDTITVSPFSSTIYMYNITKEMIDNSNNEYHRQIDNKTIDTYSHYELYPLSIILEDGNKIDSKSLSYNIESGRMRNTYSLNKPVNLDKIKTVTICGNEININELAPNN